MLLHRLEINVSMVRRTFLNMLVFRRVEQVINKAYNPPVVVVVIAF